MKKALIVFGTRPEAIKMAPLYLELKKSKIFETRLCVTSQHKEMLFQILGFFKIIPDYNLDVMKPNQNLYGLTSEILNKMKNILDDYNPDLVLVHGDTTTGMAVSLASFYNKSKIGHVEAGLRTYDKLSPFPEEMNRKLISSLADFHFCPTKISKENLVRENINKKNILVSGNTVIDSLKISTDRILDSPSNLIMDLESKIGKNKFILVTAHRRENHGDGIKKICESLIEISNAHKSLKIIFPVHLNPKVAKPVSTLLSGFNNIILTKPMNYEDFIWLMNKSELLISDSGGVQEEAPTFGKPVLVLRESIERPEALEAGTVILVGTNKKLIVKTVNELINDPVKYKNFSKLTNPYGDGTASVKIRNFIEKHFKNDLNE